MQLTLLLWLGCRAADVPASRPLPSTPVGSLETGAATAHAGTEPAELPMPIPALEGWTFLPPGLRIVGEPELQVLSVAIIPAMDNEPPAFAVDARNDGVVYPVGAPSPLVAAGIGGGTYSILDVWDGISSFHEFEASRPPIRVRDVTGDNIPDVWTNRGLFAGPMLGRAHRPTDALVTFDGTSIELAGFDADRDGVDDVMVGSGSYVTILYGPFEPGQVLVDEPAIGTSPYSFSVLAGFGSSEGGVARLPDLLGPGRDAFAVGDPSNSPVAYKIYPLDVPRGTRSMDAIAGFDVSNVEHLLDFDTPGDLDGDAEPELIVSSWAYSADVMASPVQGMHTNVWPYTPNLDAPGEFPGPSSVLYGIGDLNGDGVQELAGFYVSPELEGVAQQWWVMVAFSPHALPLHFADALPIGSFDDIGWRFGDQHADIDGDGLDDVIHVFRQSVVFPGDPPARYPGTEGLGEVRVWYGADLVAAENARRARTGRPPMGAAPEVP